MAKLIFPNITEQQLEHIRKAERELSLAGITFDFGSDICSDTIISREWNFDWSLQGAKLEQ